METGAMVMDRMLFPFEGPDFETFVYDVETLTYDTAAMVCQLVGIDPIDFSVDTEAIDAVLAPLCEGTW
ncbi:hypothetical protein [Rhodococcus jostii]|uniref:hypothetical protein n=1 Tax=Rhodococcus jostii TaxID=132919 RepID=UPI00362B3C28